MAIIISATVAIVGYYFTHPIIEEIKFGGKLIYWGDYLYSDNKITGLHLWVINIGYKRTSYLDITFTAIEDKVRFRTGKKDITFVPASDFEFKKDNSHVYVKLRRPLKRGEEIQMFVGGIELEHNRFIYDLGCDIFSDFGSASQLGVFRKLDFIDRP